MRFYGRTCNEPNNMKHKQMDYLETLAEEISLTMGLRTKVSKDHILVYTIAGEMIFYPSFCELMQDVYRFIYCYGRKLTNYGIAKRIKEIN